MQLETKYDIGQELWGTREEPAYRIVACKACSNTGKVLINNEQFVCPKCKGAAAHPQYAGHKRFVWGSGRVGQVRFELTSGESFYRWHSAQEKNLKIQYMLDSTGIGSGQLWDEEWLFPSRESAEQDCADKNAALELSDMATMGKELV